MKLETVVKKPDVFLEEVLILDGEEIGWLKTKVEEGSQRCHVGLNFSKHLYWNLIQGHGPGRDESIRNAIDEARLNLHGLLKAIDNLEEKFKARDL